MKHLIPLLLLFVFPNLDAQNPDGSKFLPESKEYQEYYTNILNMYSFDAKDVFMTKANFDKTLQEEKYQSLGGEDAMLTWIEDNFEKTTFKSMDEACELYQIEKDLSKQLRLENIDLYKYIQKALLACSSGITGEVLNQLLKEYGWQRFKF